MKSEELLKRVDELLLLGKSTASTRQQQKYGEDFVSSEKFSEFRSSTLSFLSRSFGADSPFYKEFDHRSNRNSFNALQIGIGILNGVRAEISGGWLGTVRGLVSAELFSDFIEMAKHLLEEKYKDPAAVMVGSVLEGHLRQLCGKHSIPVEVAKPDGSMAALKADAMNSELAKAGVYSKLDQKSVTAWLDLRNKAAHGLYVQYTEPQVDLMLRGVSDFITRFPL